MLKGILVLTKWHLSEGLAVYDRAKTAKITSLHCSVKGGISSDHQPVCQ